MIASHPDHKSLSVTPEVQMELDSSLFDFSCSSIGVCAASPAVFLSLHRGVCVNGKHNYQPHRRLFPSVLLDSILDPVLFLFSSKRSLFLFF